MSTPADHDPDTTPAADPSFAETEMLPTDAPAEPERRFTAPSAFDAGSTQIISTPPDPATEIFDVSGTEPPTDPGRAAQATPQAIPARPVPPKRGSWGWVVALVLVIAALVAVVILVVVLLTRGDSNAAGLYQLGSTIAASAANSGGPAA